MGGADCLLRVGVIGINCKTADLSFRESIARATECLGGEAGIFFPTPTVVLSTCNRTEIYFGSPDLADAHCQLLEILRPHMREPFEHRLYSYFGSDCLAHLCRVAAGLDSAILAETDIQRQVKKAYQSAHRLTPGLHFLFQKSLKVGKEVRSRLPIERGAATLPNVLWKLIRKEGMDWSSSRTLFVGYSQINRELADYLRRKGMKQADLCTRHPQEHLPFHLLGRDVLSRWEAYDLILCASKSSQYLIDAKRVGPRPRLIFDLSVPRNVDPAVGRLPQVTLYNIEQIDQLVEMHRFAQQVHLDRCESLIREHTSRLCFSYRRKMQNASGLVVCS